MRKKIFIPLKVPGIFLLCVIYSLACIVAGCGKSSEFFIQKSAHIKKNLRPQHTFQKQAVKGIILKNRQDRKVSFTRAYKYVIELKGKTAFNWKIQTDVPSGILKFSVIFFGLNKNIKNRLSGSDSLGTIEVVIKRENTVQKIISSEIRINETTKLVEESCLKKVFQTAIKTKKNDEICFTFKVLENSYKDKLDFKYGISIPRIVVADQKSNSFNNLILISIDTLRADYLGVYQELGGSNIPRGFSPNIDALAREATVFLNVYSPQSSTWPALASMFLSLYPTQHGVMRNGEFLKYKYYSIADFMLDCGYNTVSCNGNAFQLNISGFEEKYNFFDRDFRLINFALHKIQKNQKDEPFFHWYHFLGTHANYTPPRWVMNVIEKEDKKYRIHNPDKLMASGKKITTRNIRYIRKLYAGELYHLDFELKKLFDLLKNHGLWEKSLIIITSDHGEDLYQHNNFFYHYPSIYNTSLKIPLIIKLPGQKKNIIVREPVSLLDIFPTLIHYFLGTEKPEFHHFDFAGKSLINLIKGNNQGFDERILYSGIEKFQIIAAHYNDWKLIFNPKEILPMTQLNLQYPIKKIEQYNILSDPYETKHISSRRILNFLINSIIDFKKNFVYVKPSMFVREAQLDSDARKEAEEVLKTLGYIN